MPRWVSEGSRGAQQNYTYLLRVGVKLQEKLLWQRRGYRRPWLQQERGQMWPEMQDDPLVGKRLVSEVSIAIS